MHHPSIPVRLHVAEVNYGVPEKTPIDIGTYPEVGVITGDHTSKEGWVNNGNITVPRVSSETYAIKLRL